MQVAHARRSIAQKAKRAGELGASLVEYALLVALIAVVCIVAVTYVGKSSSGKFGAVGSSMGGAAPALPTCDLASMHQHFDGTWHKNDPSDAQVDCTP